MKKTFSLFAFLCIGVAGFCQQVITFTKEAGAISVLGAPILLDPNDFALVNRSAELLAEDFERVTGEKKTISSKSATANTAIIIGSLSNSSLIKKLVASKKINPATIKGKWEAYLIQQVSNPFPGISHALVIAGNDRRGTAFGVFDVSQQLGVSPWCWWADVPVQKREAVFLRTGARKTDAPLVKYRGIFINDEAPALSNWSRATFGGFNHLFYEKVFELMLRLKSNYIWPAMWGNAFYDDDSLNIKMADKYGIVIGTSHHEPLMRAHDEWRRYGNKQKWNYDSTEAGLRDFWRKGMQRATNEKIVSVVMRGDGDEPMTRETATALLERIVSDQRKIIAEVTGKPATETPQLWALYKEVQDYYDKGMRVPDDVTLLLCDDNWGNIRKLPKVNEKPRKGGYGIYYHFDYVGGPRNYKWINTNSIPRVWEQMHMAWQYKARQIWIVNVGDIKPMEYPISFFLEYAWNPTRIGAGDLQRFAEKWAAAQFPDVHAVEIADILSKYSKYNSRRKPEMLSPDTYNLEEEWPLVIQEYNQLLTRAEKVNNALPAEYKDAYFQLVLHPVRASANINELYHKTALNRKAAAINDGRAANQFGYMVQYLYKTDSLITQDYHTIRNGKWNHMMSQTHIGYTNWQQPPFNKIPDLKFFKEGEGEEEPPKEMMMFYSAQDKIPAGANTNTFYEAMGVVSIDASHFTRAVNANGVRWQPLPDHGRTGSAITSFPVTAAPQKPGSASPHVQYEFYTYDSSMEFTIQAYFSPTLNFHNTEQGLQYAISVDNEKPQIISINKEDRNTGSGIWNKWAGENIIIKSSKHLIGRAGKHTIKYWMVNSGVVLQKLVADFGGAGSTYLGPPETRKQQN